MGVLDLGIKLEVRCGVCGEAAALWKVVDGIKFTDCAMCESIAMDEDQLTLADAGNFEVHYDQNYWSEELSAAKERAWGPSLARAAEAILLCRRPVQRFLDVATGPGFLLDSLSYHLPSSKERFFGVERFPPVAHSAHAGFVEGTVAELEGTFDCGVCIETIEHLTPGMLRQLARELSWVSQPGSFFIFNTGLSAYVRNEDPGYIDPRNRGHIVSWGFRALVEIFGAEGFKVHRLGNRNWAFAVEYLPETDVPISARMSDLTPADHPLLNDAETGMALYILARDSLRADECQLPEPQSHLPLLGLAKVKKVHASLFPDAWMGKLFLAEVELFGGVTSLTANLWLPADRTEEIDICLTFGRFSTCQRMVGGMNEIKLEVRHGSGEHVTLSISAGATYTAMSHDFRQVSVVVHSILLSQ